MSTSLIATSKAGMQRGHGSSVEKKQFGKQNVSLSYHPWIPWIGWNRKSLRFTGLAGTRLLHVFDQINHCSGKGTNILQEQCIGERGIHHPFHHHQCCQPYGCEKAKNELLARGCCVAATCEASPPSCLVRKAALGYLRGFRSLVFSNLAV